MILVYGATGTTGRLIVAALEALGTPYLVAGRDHDRTAAAAGPSCRGVRVGLDLSGVSVLVNAVGPFVRLGPPVLDAAIRAGVHYVDTTAEHTFLLHAATRHDDALAAGICALPASGIDFAPAFLGAALVGTPCETWFWLDDFAPSKGTTRSAVESAGRGPIAAPRPVRFAERSGWAVPFPGGESALLHRDCRTSLVLPLAQALSFSALQLTAKLLPFASLADPIADRVPEPTPSQRHKARYTFVTHGATHTCRIDGQDVYASTGAYVATIATWLAEGRARARGVLPTGAALPAVELLNALPVRWSLTERGV